MNIITFSLRAPQHNKIIAKILIELRLKRGRHLEARWKTVKTVNVIDIGQQWVKSTGIIANELSLKANGNGMYLCLCPCVHSFFLFFFSFLLSMCVCVCVEVPVGNWILSIPWLAGAKKQRKQLEEDTARRDRVTATGGRGHRAVQVEMKCIYFVSSRLSLHL